MKKYLILISFLLLAGSSQAQLMAYGPIHSKGETITAGDGPIRDLLLMGDRILAINPQGEVWAYKVFNSITESMRLPGALVAPGQDSVAKIYVEGNKIMLRDSSQALWAYNVDSVVGEPYPGTIKSGGNPKSGGHPVSGGKGRPRPGNTSTSTSKYSFNFPGTQVSVKENGEIWGTPNRMDSGNPYKMNPEPVDLESVPILAAFKMDNGIVFVKQNGELVTYRVVFQGGK